MRVYDIIAKKRDGLENTKEELNYLIQYYVNGAIQDEQMAAWLMAVYLRGMNERETADLTELMMHSGECLDLSAINGIVVDKHSTGGVGDKTTLIVAPIVAAAGVPVAKLSGKGLGFTGGTIDKLESIPGLKTTMSNERFIKQVNEIGLAVISQTQNLVPADKKIYALRDVTATVESIPLIASSIMSKKLASGAAKIVLDVKFGSGAFMKTIEEARKLAQTMVTIGKNLQRETVAILSSMEQPLGSAIGNTLEILEAMDVLQGQGPEDLRNLCLILAGKMIALNGKVASQEEGRRIAEKMIQNRAGYAKFLEMVEAQGGDINLLDQRKLEKAEFEQEVFSSRSGYITAIDAQKIGYCSMLLGAGRERKEDSIDLSAGIVLGIKMGDFIEKEVLMATIYYNAPFLEKAALVAEILNKAITIGDKPISPKPLVAGIID